MKVKYETIDLSQSPFAVACALAETEAEFVGILRDLGFKEHVVRGYALKSYRDLKRRDWAILDTSNPRSELSSWQSGESEMREHWNYKRSQIYGIPCYVESENMRQAIRFVLREIRRCSPEDFRRIQRRVLYFTSQQCHFLDEKKRVLGRFVGVPDLDNCPGYVEFSEKIPPKHFKGVVAHELGHACGRRRDYAKWRFEPEEFKEIRELVADNYARKWGLNENYSTRSVFLDWRDYPLSHVT
jgi:hypothetical protein